MPKTSSQQSLSKRQAMKQQRLVKARRDRMVTIGVIFGVIVLFVVLFLTSQNNQAQTAVGDFVRITPGNYPEANGRTMGDPSAPVKIEVFSDFHCTACAAYTQNVEPLVISQIIQSGKAYYYYRHYPFMDDGYEIKDSDLAAHASLCAAEQNRFFDYKNMLYTNMNNIMGEFSLNRLIAFAEALDLDKKEFTTCMEENRFEQEIQADIKQALEYGATGTPSIFVNGKAVSPGYVPSFEQINEAVLAALAESE